MERIPKYCKIAKLIPFFLVILIAVPTLNGQGYKGIVPLESTCEEVNRIFKAESCSKPQSTFFLPDVWITVTFSTNKVEENGNFCYKLPVGRVLSVLVTYNQSIPIGEFEYKLDYVKGSTGDIETTEYQNADKGIRALANLGRVNTVIYVPTREQEKLLGINCESPCTKKERIGKKRMGSK